MDQRICSVEGCTRHARKRGWCSAHYQRWRRHGDTAIARIYTEQPEVCTIEGCDRPTKARGWCKGHYHRWYTTGDPGSGSLERESLAERMAKFTRISTVDGCHVWIGDRNHKGYGRINVGTKTRPAHVIAYELAKGPIPKGLEPDHLCHRTYCVNPEHLEAVTHSENVRRAFAWARLKASWGRPRM